MKSRNLPILVALTLSVGPWLESVTAATGAIVGAVVLPATDTKPRSFRGNLYRNRLAPNRSDGAVAIPARSPLDDVVISAHRLDGDTQLTQSTSTMRMDQLKARFIPRVLPVTVGDSVEFVNKDRFFHNVFSLHPENKFNIGRRPTGEVAVHTFIDTGVVDVFCDIHPQMSATILVLDTPWFTKPDSSGAFQLHGLPEGRYSVRAFHPEHGSQQRTITVGDGAPMAQSFVFGR